MKAIYGLYAQPDGAQRAVNHLRIAGVAERDIVIMSGEPVEEYEFSRREKETWMFWLAGLGGLVGLAVGTGLSILTQTAWPLVTGNMPIVAWWPNLIIMFETTMLGAVLATVITLLVTAILRSGTAKVYDPAVSDGKILVGVQNPPGASMAELERALRAGGAEQLKTV